MRKFGYYGSDIAGIIKAAITGTSTVCVLSSWEKCKTLKIKLGGSSAADHKKCDYC